MERRGKLITFEGEENSGKDTQLKIYCGKLTAKGIPFKLYVEPKSGTDGRIRDLILAQARDYPDQPFHPIAEFLLFAAERAQLYQGKITYDLGNGEIVLLNRSLDSSDVYQGAGCFHSNREILEMIKKVNYFAITERRFKVIERMDKQERLKKEYDFSNWIDGRLLLPDKTLIFDIDLAYTESRNVFKTARSIEDMEKDTIESRNEAYHKRVIDRYRKLAKEEPKRITLIDGRKSIEEIAIEVENILNPLLGINSP